MDDVAVVGIGLRFPGEATSPEALWEVLRRGESQWSEFPRDRLNIDGYYHPGGDRQGSISFRGAHFLKGNIASFDAPFFSVPAEDAKAIDPQQRHLLEVSYEALENAGIRKEDVDGSDTAVYVGSFVKDYEQICLRDPDWQPQYAATGNGIAIMANRISYAFNFHGPSVTVDTGCSGSLVSVHMAAQSLRQGECSMALAAGAGMILTPNTIMPMTALNFLSPDGKCFTFDSRANGYGRGEGIGVVVLKRLSDALRDDDPIRAVIRGTRVNQDGRTTGITLPSKEAQVANIRSLYKSVGLDFAQTGYVECHGTGTTAGDWRELKAVSETLATSRDRTNPIVVGSVKPNIGHLEGAAGIAGLIKGVLMLERGKIPPNINFDIPNPDIQFDEWKVAVPTKLMDWPVSGPRRASVNCFGFGGTNAHVILDEASGYLSSRRLSRPSDRSPVDRKSTNGVHLFCFSANDRAGVERVIESQIPYLQSKLKSGDHDSLPRYAYSLGCRRSLLEWKTTIVASSTEDLLGKMKAHDSSSSVRSSADRKPKVCFVFCGQGSHWAQMGHELMVFKPFRESLKAAADYMQMTLGSSFNLVKEMFKPEEDSILQNPEIAQPATTALQVALVDLLGALLVKPAQVVGHSSGEIAAAYASGAISRESAWKIAYYRGKASALIPVKRPDLSGSMMAVAMPREQCQEYLESNAVSTQIACINGPQSVTLSGEAHGIRSIAADLRQKDIFHKILPVTTAYHSDHMKLVMSEYSEFLGHIPAKDSTTAMFSSVTGSTVDGEALKTSYWVQNMISPVEYLSAIRSVMQQPSNQRPDIMLEISPRAVLRTPTLDTLESYQHKSKISYFTTMTPKGNCMSSLLQVLGHLWSRGCSVSMEKVVSRGDKINLGCLVDLPPYPWNHDTAYWHESHLGEANRFRKHPRKDLIGAPTADSTPFEPRWRGFLRTHENPWIQDHQVQKTIVYPAAGMLCMVLEAANQMADDKTSLMGYEVVDMRIEKAMVIPTTAHGLETALNIKRNTNNLQATELLGLHDFTIYSKHLGGPWEKNASGFLRFKYRVDGSELTFPQLNETCKALGAHCADSTAPRQLYELLEGIGMNYGPHFRNITEVCKHGNSCTATIKVPDTKSKMPAKFEYSHLLHPATLDAMFHSLFAIETSPMVPTSIGSLFVSNNLVGGSSKLFRGCATAATTQSGFAVADISMKLDDADSYVMVKGLELTSIPSSAHLDGGFLPNHHSLCTQIVWQEDITFSPSAFTTDAQLLKLLVHKFPGLRILQVGGNATIASSLLAQFSQSTSDSKVGRYTITNVRSHEVENFMQIAKETEIASLMDSIEISDVSRSQAFDCIIACPGWEGDIEELTKHLRIGGLLLRSTLSESIGSHPMARTDSGVDLSQSLPTMCVENPRLWQLPHHDVVFLCRTVYQSDGESMAALFTQIFSRAKIGLRAECVTTDDFKRDPQQVSGKVVVSIVDVAGEAGGSFIYDWSAEDFEAFKSLNSLAKGIVWLTRAAHMEPMNPKASPVVALARTLMSEDPQMTFITFDLSSQAVLLSRDTSIQILQVISCCFEKFDPESRPDMEYAEKDGAIFIPRLLTMDSLNSQIEGTHEPGERTNRVSAVSETASQAAARKIATIKASRDARGLVQFKPESPKPHEVQIKCLHSHMSFQDLDNLQAKTCNPNFGMDVRGHVTDLGHSVLASQLPQAEVVALVPAGGICTSLNVDPRFVISSKHHLLPSALVSAVYALLYIGRVGQGRKVLVHAGASCFGLAALVICRMSGAEAFAVTYDDKTGAQREVLQAQGVPTDRIFDGDRQRLVMDLRAATTGKGVDVVYNPTQRNISTCMDCVRQGGTVVQSRYGSTKMQSVDHGTPQHGTYVNFDLADLMADDSDFVAGLLKQGAEFVESHGINNVSVPKAEVTRIEDAIDQLQISPFLGHVAISCNESSSENLLQDEPHRHKELSDVIDPHGAYLLAGGLGGLGRSIARLLVDNGAKHLVFLSRTGASTDQSRDFLKTMSQRGVDVRVFQTDICDYDSLEAVFRTSILPEVPTIRGLFQCAAVIRDTVFENMTYDDWTAAFRPKAVGSDNLAKVVERSSPDAFYVFLASSAGVIGNRGQANYAAGNGFEDALAKGLQHRGKHAVSIDLGPVLGAGMLAEDEKTLDILKASGFYGIRHEDFIKVVRCAIVGEIQPGVPVPPQVIMALGTGGLIRQNKPADPYWSRTALFSHLRLIDMPPLDTIEEVDAPTQNFKTTLASCHDLDSATDVICTSLLHMLAKSMNMTFDEMISNKTPSAYGVDSLVAVGVRNWVFTNCGVQVSVFEVMSEKTVWELAELIAERGGFGTEVGE